MGAGSLIIESTKIKELTLDNEVVLKGVEEFISFNFTETSPWKELGELVTELTVTGTSCVSVDFDSGGDLKISYKPKLEIYGLEVTEELRAHFDEAVQNEILDHGEEPDNCWLRISGITIDELSFFRGNDEVKELVPIGPMG